MASGQILSASEESLLKLHEFIAGVSKGIQSDYEEVTETALCLLNTLPAARDAVLEYFFTVFHHSVFTHFSSHEGNETEKKGKDETENSLIEKIQKTLSDFINSNSEVWAPMISEWSLDLLGQISVKHAPAYNGLTLSDRLQLWMACDPTRTLIEINMQCLQFLMDSSTDSCVSILLDKSLSYSPHFDWVVAHVGSCFPRTVINKVLYCGLRDFCVNEQDMKIPKLNSVVGILAHLARAHFNDIKAELHSLFMWSLSKYPEVNTQEDKNITAQKTATVPFLLQICSLAPVLLKALSQNTIQSLNVELLLSLSTSAPMWWTYFENGRKGLIDLVIHLLLNFEHNIPHIVPLLFEMATLNDLDIPSASLIAAELIEFLISEIHIYLRANNAPPFVRCVSDEISSLHRLLLSEQEYKLSMITRFFCVIGKHNDHMTASCIAYLLPRSYDAVHITGLEDLIVGLNDFRIFSFAFSSVLIDYKTNNTEDKRNYHLTLWRTTEKLLTWEQKSDSKSKPVTFGLVDNFKLLIENLRLNAGELNIASKIASLISQLLTVSHRQLFVDESLLLVEATFSYFYSVLINEQDEMKKHNYCSIMYKLLFKMCVSSPVYVRLQALNLLLVTALNPPISPIFGATLKTDNPDVLDSEYSLLKNNITVTDKLILPAQKSMSVFQTGILGSGMKPSLIKSKYSKFQIESNTQHLINAIRSCCLTENMNINVEIVYNFALSLVQLVSTDIMFNGFPWPEEEFSKYTLERDISIRHSFEHTPVLWSILNFFALQRPTLCYCSVLLRAIIATLIPNWFNVQYGRYVGNVEELKQITIRILKIMSLGQLLPPPLDTIQLVIPHVPPGQVVTLLRECIWNYMRDHVPAPALFARDGNGVQWRDPTLSVVPKQYTEPHRFVLMNNLLETHNLYRKICMNLNKSPE